MPKRVVYLYKDEDICLIPTEEVEELKEAAGEVFDEYKKYRAERRAIFERKLKNLAKLLVRWTRPPWGL